MDDHDKISIIPFIEKGEGVKEEEIEEFIDSIKEDLDSFKTKLEKNFKKENIKAEVIKEEGTLIINIEDESLKGESYA